MNYSKSIKKNVLNRIMISWVVVFLIGIVLGVAILSIGQAIHKKSVNHSEIEQAVEVQKYGTYDGRIFTSEMSLDWSSGYDMDFVPLDCGMDEDFQEFVYCLSYGYNIDFPFVMAVMEKESQFSPSIVSKTNDYGLMQINQVNHQWLSESLGIKDFLNPYQNTRAGLYILRTLFEKYEDPNKVLMAYNMGESGAKKLWDKGIESTGYSEDILKKANEYSKQIEQGKDVKND